MVIISESISSMSAAIIFAIIFLSILAYLIMSGSVENARYHKMKKARRLIEEGHTKALKGSRHDGVFREIKRERYKEEHDKCMEKARNIAKQDLSLLS